MISQRKSQQDKQRPYPERVQTDTSLRAERQTVDEAVDVTFSALEQLADAVIEKARGRADAVLAASRAKEDRANERANARAAGLLARDRTREDALLRRERAEADEVVRQERAEADEVVRTERRHLAALRRDTDEHLLEERSQADDALATRDEFLGIVSHDLRNMLGLMMGFAALIERTGSHESFMDMARLNAQRIQSSGARMGRLIGDLVDIVSIEAGALAVSHEIVNPVALATEAVDTFQTQAVAAELTLEVEVQPVPLVRLDPFRIFQVLTNLLSNAIKFTPRRGRIVVRVEQLGDELRFGVRDTGPGIDGDKLEAIFERFHRLAPTDHRSVGLGLYISKCIVQGHRGRIWAESELGEGSCFYFTLPVARGPE